MRNRLGKWTRNPKVNLYGCAFFLGVNLTLAIRYTVTDGHELQYVIHWLAVVLLVPATLGWVRRLQQQNGGVFWIPKVKLTRQFPTRKSGPYIAQCGNQEVKVGPGPYWADGFRKPGDLDWEGALKLATEEVVEKYRDGKLRQREDRKTRKRIFKEARRGHRENAAEDPSGAVEGTGFEPGDLPTAAKISRTITAAGGLCAPLPRYATTATSPGLTIHSTHVSLHTEAPDDDATRPPEPDEELDTYTIPVWGFRSWNLLDGGGVPKLGSLNSGRHVWTPGVNVATCQAGYDFQSLRGSVSVSVFMDANPHIPGDQCSCGFYAVRDVFDVPSGIIGGVVGWGKVVDGEKGWRAEKAAVAALLQASWASVEEQQKVEMLAELYNVPICLTLIDLADKTRELAEWMAGDDLLEGTVT